MGAEGADVLADRVGHLLDDFGLEGSSQADGLGVTGHFAGHESGEAFFVDHGGDFEPCFFGDVFLDFFDDFDGMRHRSFNRKAEYEREGWQVQML